MTSVSESWHLQSPWLHGDIYVIRAPLHPRVIKSSPPNPLTPILSRELHLRNASVEVVFLPSVFARHGSLLAPQVELNPVALTTVGGWVGGGCFAQRGWRSPRPSGYPICNTVMAATPFVLAACSERLPMTGPDDRGERLPRRLQ